MPMQDWNGYRKALLEGVRTLGTLTPGTTKAYAALGAAGAQTARFDAKTRELFALVAAVSLRCDGCITVHAAEARRHGATDEELAEALGVAIAVNAGAALVYSARTLEAFTDAPSPSS